MTWEQFYKPQSLNASDEGDDLFTGEQLRAAVAAERERLLSTEIHSCHADCQRFACVQTRKAVEAEREACKRAFDAYLLNSDPGPLRARGEMMSGDHNMYCSANQMPKHLNSSYEGDDLFTGEQLRAAVAAEREACAKLCEEPGWNAANWCAKQIRARGENK
jgi:hypothetical protein